MKRAIQNELLYMNHHLEYIDRYTAFCKTLKCSQRRALDSPCLLVTLNLNAYHMSTTLNVEMYSLRRDGTGISNTKTMYDSLHQISLSPVFKVQ